MKDFLLKNILIIVLIFITGFSIYRAGDNHKTNNKTLTDIEAEIVNISKRDYINLVDVSNLKKMKKGSSIIITTPNGNNGNEFALDSFKLIKL